MTRLAPATDAELLAAIDRGITAGDLVALTPDLLAAMGRDTAARIAACAACPVCATFPPIVAARNICTHGDTTPPAPARGPVLSPPCDGAPDLCRARSGEPCAPGCPSRAVDPRY